MNKLITPKVSKSKTWVTIFFGAHALDIDLVKDALYLDLKPLKTTAPSNYVKGQYIQGYAKSNHKPRNYKPILRLEYDPYVFLANMSQPRQTSNHHLKGDGRIFFLCYHKTEYAKYRGTPFWKASYWNDRYTHERKFYENDLSKPIQTFKYQPKKAIPLMEAITICT